MSEYLANTQMAEANEWGTDLEVFLLSNMLDVNIVVRQNLDRGGRTSVLVQALTYRRIGIVGTDAYFRNYRQEWVLTFEGCLGCLQSREYMA